MRKKIHTMIYIVHMPHLTTSSFRPITQVQLDKLMLRSTLDYSLDS